MMNFRLKHAGDGINLVIYLPWFSTVKLLKYYLEWLRALSLSFKDTDSKNKISPSTKRFNIGNIILVEGLAFFASSILNFLYDRIQMINLLARY